MTRLPTHEITAKIRAWSDHELRDLYDGEARQYVRRLLRREATRRGWTLSAPMGRPPAGPDKRERIPVYLSPEEVAAVDESRGGRSRSEWIRAAVLYLVGESRLTSAPSPR